MQVEIKRTRRNAVIPEYQTNGSACFDLHTAKDVTIAPKEIVLIPTGLIINTPENHVLLIADRSSNPKKRGIQQPHSIGIVDSDFCGPDDEIHILTQNISDKPVTIESGTRIAQGMIIPVDRVSFKEVEQIAASSRGGFGSTGA